MSIKIIIKTIIIMVLVTAILATPLSCLAETYLHSGGTDSQGGHYNRSTGEYHYHHGKPAHDHINGVCPYDNSPSKDTDIKEIIKKVFYFLFFAFIIFIMIYAFIEDRKKE